MARFVILNRKQRPDNELKKKIQVYVNGEGKYAGDIVNLDPNSNDAKELVNNGWAAPADGEAKKAFKDYKEVTIEKPVEDKKSK